jgi:hypothetical protein
MKSCFVNKPDKQEIQKSEPQSVTLFSRGLRMENEKSPIFSRVLTGLRVKYPETPPSPLGPRRSTFDARPRRYALRPAHHFMSHFCCTRKQQQALANIALLYVVPKFTPAGGRNLFPFLFSAFAISALASTAF